jgi:hypothetical protein
MDRVPPIDSLRRAEIRRQVRHDATVTALAMLPDLCTSWTRESLAAFVAEAALDVALRVRTEALEHIPAPQQGATVPDPTRPEYPPTVGHIVHYHQPHPGPSGAPEDEMSASRVCAAIVTAVEVPGEHRSAVWLVVFVPGGLFIPAGRVAYGTQMGEWSWPALGGAAL